jgi:transcription initiation factor TFIIH subunit 1
MVILWFTLPYVSGHKFNKVDGSKPTPPLLNLSKDSDKVRSINLKHTVLVWFIDMCFAFVSFTEDICDVHSFFFPQGGGYMFEFDNVGTRDSCRDFVGNTHSV